MSKLLKYFTRSFPLSLLIALTILSACKNNCDRNCEGAGLLAGEAIALAGAPLIPGVLVSHALARGPTPIVSESVPGVNRTLLFDTDLLSPRAIWLAPDMILLSGGKRGGEEKGEVVLESRIVSLDPHPSVKIVADLYGWPLGITDAGLVTAKNARIMPDDKAPVAKSTIRYFDPKTLSMKGLRDLDCEFTGISIDGRRVQCATLANSYGLDIFLIDTRNWNKIAKIHRDFGFDRPNADAQTAFAFDNNDDFLIGSSTGKLGRYYSPTETKSLSSPFKPGRIWSLAAIPNSTSIVAAVEQPSSTAGSVVIFDPEKGTKQFEVPIPQGISTVEFSVNDNGRMLAIREEHQAEVYDLQTGTRVALITIGENYQMLSASLDKEGQAMIVTDANKVAVFRLSPKTASH